MRRTIQYLVIASVASAAVLFMASQGFPCSTFVLADGDVLLFGRNWDHYTSSGLIIVNKRGISKTALILPPAEPAQWTSTYGSITFNQIGKEFPYGGMNEEGLVVEIMWLEETRYPGPSELPALNEVQWVQYQLDNCGTVDEVIESTNKVRIGQSWSKIHYLVCDRFGKSAAIEFINGEFVCHTGDSLPVAALTNTPYDECIQLQQASKEFGGEEVIAHSSLSSNDRFLTIARRIDDFKSGDIEPAVAYAFDILASVSVSKFRGHRTAWSIVYDIANLKIYFKSFENRNARIIDMLAFDFSPELPSKVLDVTSRLKGNVSGNFADYSLDMNRAVIDTVLAIYREAGFLTDLPEFAGSYLANYPETFTAPQKRQ